MSSDIPAAKRPCRSDPPATTTTRGRPCGEPTVPLRARGNDEDEVWFHAELDPGPPADLVAAAASMALLEVHHAVRHLGWAVGAVDESARVGKARRGASSTSNRQGPKDVSTPRLGRDVGATVPVAQASVSASARLLPSARGTLCRLTPEARVPVAPARALRERRPSRVPRRRSAYCARRPPRLR